MLLVSMIVHDLRSPLTSITMLTAAIEPADPASRAALEDLISEAERVRHMLSDTLDICLNQVGELRLRAHTFEFQELAERVHRRMHRLSHARSQTLTLSVPNSAVQIVADPELLERVIENLVANAIHHGPRDRPIAMVLTQAGPDSLRFEVRDQGEAVPAQSRESIFRLFEVLEHDTAPLHRGHGLGLSFCRMVIRAHGGAIGVEPNPDRGNCFYFELPTDARQNARAQSGNGAGAAEHSVA
jgi:K+-sensing histidine kinase KdpD